MYRSQVLALKYFTAAITLFGVMTLTGLVSAYYYVNAEFLFGILPFNIAKILHINTLVLWLLIGFMGSIYWFLPQELGRETAGVVVIMGVFAYNVIGTAIAARKTTGIITVLMIHLIPLNLLYLNALPAL